MSKRNENRLGYKQTKIGWIPEDWEAYPLGGLVEIKSGNSPSIYKPSKSGKYPFIKVEELNNSSKIQITARQYSDIEISIVPKMAILFAKRGAAIETNKVRIADQPLVMDSNMMALIPQNIDSEFLYYEILHQKLWKIADTSSIPQINNKHIIPYKIPLPPPEEQQKIAEILSAWDRAIDQTKKLIEAKQALKKGLMQQLLTGRMRFPQFGKPVKNKGELPDGWANKKLLHIGLTYAGLSGKTKDDFGSGKAYLPYLNVFNNEKININNLGSVIISEKEKQNIVKKGDMFFTISSETPEEIGMSSVLLDELEEAYLNSFCFGFRLSSKKYLLPEFARFYMRGIYFRSSVMKLAQGATRFNLSKNKLINIQLYLPAINEQNKISSLLFSSSNEIEFLQKKESILQKQKKGLMQKLLTGEIRAEIKKGNNND